MSRENVFVRRNLLAVTILFDPIPILIPTPLPSRDYYLLWCSVNVVSFSFLSAVYRFLTFVTYRDVLLAFDTHFLFRSFSISSFFYLCLHSFLFFPFLSFSHSFCFLSFFLFFFFLYFFLSFFFFFRFSFIFPLLLFLILSFFSSPSFFFFPFSFFPFSVFLLPSFLSLPLFFSFYLFFSYTSYVSRFIVWRKKKHAWK